MQAEQRERDREQQQSLEAERHAAAERVACADILRNDVDQPRGRGSQRWYFQLENGLLPWFEVDENMGFQLQNGAYWVVRVGPRDSHNYGLLAPELGQRVAAVLPESVVWAPGRS